MNNLKAFQIKIGGQILDYGLGKQLSLEKIRSFFKKSYEVKNLWTGGRHVLGILERDDRKLFLKLSTTKGISELTKNEFRWNEQFHELVSRKLSNYWVPQNIASGMFNDRLFYLITDYFEGQMLIKGPGNLEISKLLIDNIDNVINFSELIQNLKLENFYIEEDQNFRKSFLNKVISWYKEVPENIAYEYKINDLLKIIERDIDIIQSKPRHGDFTPWHLIKLTGGQLGLIDGEHAKKNGVEYYDIGYFIQRVFSELRNQNLAEKILSLLVKKNYNIGKLKIVLAARGIGGFLDESLKPSPDYTFSNKFKSFVETF